MLFFQVFPTRAGNDPRDLRPTDTKLLSQEYIAPPLRFEGKKLVGLGVGELGRAIRAAAHSRAMCPPFLLHILHIVVMGSEEKVIRPHAAFVVTFMEYVKAGRDRAVVNLPTDTMRLKHWVAARGGDNTVAVGFVLTGRPLPTPPALADIAPKALFQSSVSTSHVKRSYSYGQPQERDRIPSVTANSVTMPWGVCAPPGRFTENSIARMFDNRNARRGW